MPTNVSEVTQELMRIVQNNLDLRDVWIQGEISNIIRTQGGVHNFTLEGNGQKIECVIFADRAFLQESLPPVESNVHVKGQIYVYETISEYRFRVTDIHRTGVPFPTPRLSINDLTGNLRDTLNQVPPVEVQGKIAEVFETSAGFTILKLKDVTTDERVNKVIECALPPGIAPPFRLQQGNRITVKGKFGIFANASAYRIEIDDANNIIQVIAPPMAVAAPLNECQDCRQRFSNLQDQLCHVCYYARLTYEGIVVGAVMRYFDSPRFANFSIQREREICFGGGSRIIGRADIALLNNEGNPVAIAECKRIGYDGNDGIDQLKGYINPTVANLGLFADNTDPYEWTFLKKNNERHRFDRITRSQFERELGVEPAPEIPATKTRLEIIQGDIVKAKVNAIVNAANAELTRGSGVDRAIREAGGEEIDRECERILEDKGPCPRGKAVITKGGDLPAAYVIHTVGPIWQDGEDHESEVLARCYKNSLKLAGEERIQSIAFPAISTGNYRYPIEEAAHVALTAVKEFVEHAHQNNEMVPQRIQFVLFDQEAYACYVKELSNLGFSLSCQIG